MRSFLTAALLGFTLTTVPAYGAENADAMPGLTVKTETIVAAAAVNAATTDPFSSHVSARLRRPAVLPALYVASAALQGYDAYSTLTVLKSGGVEANPMMKAAVKNPAVFVALKAGVAATSVMAAERMWKNGNRLGAIGMMVASNVAMSLVAAHNTRVLNSLE